MRRLKIILGIVVVLSFTAAVECHAQKLDRALLTHSSESISITPLIYGIEKGFYRKEGVDLQFRILRGDLLEPSKREAGVTREINVNEIVDYRMLREVAKESR